MSWAGAEADVVVVGAGPVGLLLAGDLARAGISVLAVERRAEPMSESRASQLSTRTAELLQERGLDRLLAEAKHEPRGHFAGLTFDLSGPDSEYWGNWKVPQYRTEAALSARALELGVTLLRTHELTQITSGPDEVDCELAGPAGRVRVRARYLVGCDGAESTVRRIGGFPVSTVPATTELLRADITGVEIRDRRFERLENGFAVAATRDGVTRVMVHGAGRPALTRRAAPRFEEVAGLWAEVTGEDISGAQVLWLDSFGNGRGQADQYRRGRLLLAGDAAHWHLPVGGQALNTGLQDAADLGWKLAGTVTGWAAAGLLDSYPAERHPVAARILNQVAAQEILLLGGPEINPLRSVLAELIGLAPVREHLVAMAANLGLGGTTSPAGAHVRSLGLRTTAGPLRVTGAEPLIVRLAPDTGPVSRSGLRTLYASRSGPEADHRQNITSLLLRPDGYIAWAGDLEEDLDQAIGTLLRPGGRTGHAKL